VVWFGTKLFCTLALEQLPAGQLLHINRIEFNWKKRTPLYFINQITKATGKKFTIAETHNHTRWIVESIKENLKTDA
jgi:formate hydrogenlyase subunit 6/NADH:ubiquinone oxidoreductase subunit I